MSLFSKKIKISLVEYCSYYYDEFLLKHRVENGIISDEILGGFRNSIIEKDIRFEKVSPQKFIDELLPLQLELFALVWLHKYGDKSAVAQSMFTKEYLYNKKLEKIWLGMEKYNQSINRSSVVGLDKPQIVLNNKRKADLANTYIKFFRINNIELDERSGRPINRLFTENAWAKGITPGFLMLAFSNTLEIEEDFQPKEDGQLYLITILMEMYNIIMHSLNEVKIVN